MRVLLDSNVWRYVIDSGALPDVLIAARKSPHSVVIAPAVAYEAMLRDEAAHLPQKLATAPLIKNQASFQKLTAGWDGTPFELWRIDGLNVFRMSMALERHALAEWLEGDVDLELMTFESASLVRFWAHDVEPLRMPRHWLRSSFEFLQRFHKVTDGTPADNQLGTHLVEADVMLSADKNLVRIAERCREEAPFPMARSFLVAAGSRAAEAVLALLTRTNGTTATSLELTAARGR
jgi:hypothetical protein